MKLKSVAVAVALAAVGMAANAGSYSLSPGSLPGGVLFTEATTFAGSGSAYGSAVTSFDLYSVTIGALGLPTSPSLVQTGTSFNGIAYNLATKVFGAGSYYAVATGSGTFSGLQYTTTAVAAVPEPETYAMMLAGLGVMGFVAARRKS